MVTGRATCATSTAGEGEGGAIGLADCANGFGAADRSAATGADCMNGFAWTAGGVTAAGFACTGGGASGASNAGRLTGLPCTGGVHGASGVADCGKGGGRFEAGLRIGFGGGDDGIADAGRWIGAGGADTGPALADGAMLVPSSGGRLRFGGGGGWLTFGRACATAPGAWLGTGRWGGGGGAAD